MKRLMHKLNSARGFTLTEVLAVVIILLLVTSIVAGGIPVAANAYRKVVDAGNAQMLLSTTMTRLRDELGQATEVDAADGAAATAPGVTFRGGNTGSTTHITSAADGIEIEEYLDPSFDAVTGIDAYRQPRLLVSKAAATTGMYAKFESVSYDDGVFTITALEVVKNGKTLASLDSFQIRAIPAAG